MSRRTCFRRAVFSSCPVACWNRRLNSSSRFCLSSCSSSWPSISLISLTFKAVLPRHETCLDRELLGGEADGLFRQVLGHAGQFEHHPAGLDHGDPLIGRTFARAHPGLGRLRRHRLVRKDVDPHLAATLDLAGHGDPGGLDLPVGHPAGLERLQTILAELHAGLALGLTGASAALLLAVLYSLG